MLKDLGVKYVVIGHSERRQYFGETDVTVNKKVHAALEVGLHPIICVGESLEQRDMGVTLELIALQVKSALSGVAPEKVRKCVVAYEPIWAIGTGRTATAEQAAEVCTAIRATIRNLYGARVARSITIQYGGSMNPKNAAELLAQPDVDGGLIGGLRAYGYPHILECLQGGRDVDEGHAHHDLAPLGAGQQGLELLGELLGVGGGFVHLPVSGDDSLAVSTVHVDLSPVYNIYIIVG